MSKSLWRDVVRRLAFRPDPLGRQHLPPWHQTPPPFAFSAILPLPQASLSRASELTLEIQGLNASVLRPGPWNRLLPRRRPSSPSPEWLLLGRPRSWQKGREAHPTGKSVGKLPGDISARRHSGEQPAQVCPFPAITCAATSPRAALPSLSTGLPQTGHRHLPPAETDRKRGRGSVRESRKEGRKLDRQTEADPGFTVPERQPPDSQTLRSELLSAPWGEGRGDLGLS